MVKTNCGQPVAHKCIKCIMLETDQNGWCKDCIINQLREDNHRLRSENSFLKQQQDPQFNKTLHLFYQQGGKKYKESPYLKEPLAQDSLYFLTITFDPNRFDGLGDNTAAEEDYILHSLALATKDKLISELVGCFELMKNGATHAHAHVTTYQPIELYRTLQKLFTYNMRNNKCIDLQIASKSDKGQAYINKHEEGKGTDNKTWFSILFKDSTSEEGSLPDATKAMKTKDVSPSIHDSLLSVQGNVSLLDAPPLRPWPLRQSMCLEDEVPKTLTDPKYYPQHPTEPEVKQVKREIKTLKKILKKKFISTSC